jgi:hypothetical protein
VSPPRQHSFHRTNVPSISVAWLPACGIRACIQRHPHLYHRHALRALLSLRRLLSTGDTASESMDGKFGSYHRCKFKYTFFAYVNTTTLIRRGTEGGVDRRKLRTKVGKGTSTRVVKNGTYSISNPNGRASEVHNLTWPDDSCHVVWIEQNATLITRYNIATFAVWMT